MKFQLDDRWAADYKKMVAQCQGKLLDSSYYAAFYLLSSDEGLAKRVMERISPDGIAFEEIREEDEHLKDLVEVARNLFSWGRDCPITPHDISCLGYPLMERVCIAIFIGSDQCKVIGEGDLIFVEDSTYTETKKIVAALEDMADKNTFPSACI